MGQGCNQLSNLTRARNSIVFVQKVPNISQVAMATTQVSKLTTYFLCSIVLHLILGIILSTFLLRIFSVWNVSFKETPSEQAIPYSRRRPYILCVCQKSQKCTLKAANFPLCNYIIQRREKVGAEIIKCIRMNFNKLLQPKQETWAPNINVKWHKTHYEHAKIWISNGNDDSFWN